VTRSVRDMFEAAEKLCHHGGTADVSPKPFCRSPNLLAALLFLRWEMTSEARRASTSPGGCAKQHTNPIQLLSAPGGLSWDDFEVSHSYRADE
jgi:hypothetical protein